MDARQLARILNGGRIVVGATAVIAPGFLGRRWFADESTPPGASVAIRAFGGRDLALGLGTVQALDAGEPAARWLQMGVVSDAIDAVATVVALRHIGARRAIPVLLTAVGAAAAGSVMAGQVD